MNLEFAALCQAVIHGNLELAIVWWLRKQILIGMSPTDNPWCTQTTCGCS